MSQSPTPPITRERLEIALSVISGRLTIGDILIGPPGGREILGLLGFHNGDEIGGDVFDNARIKEAAERIVADAILGRCDRAKPGD